MFLTFLPEPVKIAIGVLFLVVFGLIALSKRLPGVAWLQAFRIDNRLTPPQKERLRRSNERIAGAELILLGIIVPMAYLAVTVMFFSTPTPRMILLTGGISVLCIGLGITAIAKNR